jgi:hypothetical protein
MIKIYARKLLDAKPFDLWWQLTDKYIVVFDDREVEMDGIDIAISRYAWVYHTLDRNIPLYAAMTCVPYLRKGIFTNSQTRQLFNDVLWTIHAYYNGKVDAFDIVEVFQWSNMEMYNDATVHGAKYITSLGLTDYIELSNHPEFEKLREWVKSEGTTLAAVDTAIGKATALMTSGKLLDKNGRMYAIPMSCLAGIIKPPQAVQAIFMRGTIPDIKMETIPYPLTNSLLRGMNSPLELAIFSREGAIAEMASMDDLSTVCYSGRKLALVAQAKSTLIRTDCGSQDYVYWAVTEPVVVNDRVVKESNLSTLEGVWYLDSDNVLKQVTRKDTHLYGTTIRRRSVLTCKLPRGNHVCSTCMGDISYSIPDGENIGIDIAKTFTQDKAQNAMSIKHLLSTLIGESAKLDATAKKCLIVENNTYHLNAQVLGYAQRILIEIPKACVHNLSQVQTVNDVRNLIPSKITAFNAVKLHVMHSGGELSYDIALGKSTVSCMLSYEVLELIKNDPDSVTSNSTTYIINITALGGKPLFIKPAALPAISEMARNMSRIFERAGDEREITSPNDILGTSERLQDLLMEMGGMHVSITELLLSAYLVKEPEFTVENALNGLSELQHATSETLMLKRSLATWLIVNSPVIGFMQRPSTFLIRNRDDSVLDAFVDPVGVLNHEPY